MFMDNVHIISIEITDSTNRFLHDYPQEKDVLMTVAVADYQTAGRGQGTNCWESEAGKNLTFSIKVFPRGLRASRQFVMLEAEALAVAEALSAYTDGITIKWPNDIYWHDRKISGTLSECTVSGSGVGYCILGTGINVNQQVFVGDAPNPVSLSQIVGHEVDRNTLLETILHRFQGYLQTVNRGDYDKIDALYFARLYRKTGQHAYQDAGGRFLAEVHAVEPDGHFVLRREDGMLSRYAFKEVKFVI